MAPITASRAETWSIGDLSGMTAVNIETICYCERKGTPRLYFQRCHGADRQLSSKASTLEPSTPADCHRSEPHRHGWLFKSRAMGYDEIHDTESVIRRDFGVSSKILRDQGLFITTSHAPHIPINDPC
jgi:hypothetical protein